MRRMMIILLAAVSLLGPACRDVKNPEPFSVSPEKPGGLDRLTVTYRPTISGSPLARSDAVLLRYSLVSAGDRIYSDEAAMTRKEGAWVFSFPPKTDGPRDAVLMVCAFIDGKDRGIFDNNRDAPWIVLFHEKGRPVRGAHLALSRLQGGELRLDGTVEVPTDKESAHGSIERERAAYPEQPLLAATTWTRQLRELRRDPVRLDSLKARVHEGADAFFADHKEWSAPRPETVEYLDLYDAIRESGARDSLVAGLVSRFPGDTAIADYALNTLPDRGNFDASVTRIDEFLNKYPDSPVAARARGLIIFLSLNYIRTPERAREVVLSGKPVEIEDLVSYAEWLAGEGGRRDEADPLFRRCIEEERAKEWSPAGTRSRPEWEESRLWSLARSTRGLAAVLENADRSEDASNLLRQIISEAPDATEPATDLQFARLERRAGRPAAALEALDRLAEKSRPGEEALTEWRAAFEKAKEGGDFESHASAAAERRRERTLARLESRVLDQPAPDVEVEDLSGARHPLSAFRGKVVLMDFWATWCGPCQRSLPHVDKLFREMAAPGDLVVLPVNVWERTKGEERRLAVAENWKNLGMSMPTYFDPDAEGAGTTTVADRFHVPAIPTSVVIGRDGAILFKTVGFAGEEAEEDVRAKIDFALRRQANNG